MRREAGTERHRNLSTPQGTLESSLKIAMAGKPQAPTLGVAQTQALDRCDVVGGAWWNASAHRLTGEPSVAGRASVGVGRSTTVGPI